MNAEISIPVTLDRIGPHHADLLRHHADIGPLAAVIGEAIIAQAVLQMTEQDDVVLERDVRAASAATSTTAAESTAAATTKASASAAAESAATAAAKCSALSAAGKSSAPNVTDAGRPRRYPAAARGGASGRRTIAADGLPVAGALPAAIDTLGAISDTGPVRSLTQSLAWTLALTQPLTAAGGTLTGAKFLLQA